eukprot:jgi/Chrzof1/12893/Cz07g11100.t1
MLGGALTGRRAASGLGMSRQVRTARISVKRVKSQKHPQSAVGPDVDNEAQDVGCSGERGSASFRFWHDERRFKGRGDQCIVQKALFAAGGVRTGGYPKAAPIPGPLGFQRSSDWDLLWSPARTALKAIPTVKPGQLISAMPGMFSLTKKRRLSVTLSQAYGDDAWSLMPLSFSLPNEVWSWRTWLSSSQEQGSAVGPWILKTAQHLGKGLKLLPGHAALEESLKARPPGARPYVLAQRYIANPLLIDGRKFGVRVWVLVTGHNPLRAYIHSNGLVLFSSDDYDDSSIGSGDEANTGGHITNYAQNVDGQVWDLDMLKQHIGETSYQQLWAKILHNTGLVTSAALQDMQQEHAKLNLPPHSTFELLGLDYLVDTSLHPWLLEVNGTPSLAVEHESSLVQQRIHKQKFGMVKDMVHVLNCKERFSLRYQLLKSALTKDKLKVRRVRELMNGASDDALQRLLQRELQQCGGFIPLMPHFPINSSYESGWQIPFGSNDHKVQAWMQQVAVGSTAVSASKQFSKVQRQSQQQGSNGVLQPQPQPQPQPQQHSQMEVANQ